LANETFSLPLFFFLFLHFQHVIAVRLLSLRHTSTVAQETQPKISRGETNQALYNLFAAYLHTVPLQELIDSLNVHGEMHSLES
jgi:hypothetical protein